MARKHDRGEGPAFACLTAYDATTARWLDRAGVHVLLMGDSAAEGMLGHRRTIDMPMDVSIALTAAVRRGAGNALVMADMPFMSYHGSPDEAVRNAGRFLTEGGADCVKLEVDFTFAPLIDRMTRAGIPVCAHVGSRPQTAALTSGYSADGRTEPRLRQIVADAKAAQESGAALLLIEAVPPETAAAVMEIATVPVIGIGAGTAPHGQILVVHDLLGLTDQPPRFASAAAALGEETRRAASEWVRRVAQGEIGGQTYSMRNKRGGGDTDTKQTGGPANPAVTTGDRA